MSLLLRFCCVLSARFSPLFIKHEGMRSSLIISSLIALAAAMASPTLRAETVLSNGAPSTSPGTVSPAVLTVADLAENRQIVVTLKLRSLSELQARVGNGEVISSAEMAEKYLPLDSDYQAVSQWLGAQGLTVQPKAPSGASVFASGTIAQLQTALSIGFGKVTAAGVTYTSALNAPSVPDALAPAILAILGLHPEIRCHTHQAPPPPPTSDVVIPGGGAQTQPQATSNGGSPYKIGDILSAYKATNLNLNGAGQTIAIIVPGYPNNSDLTAFWNANGVSQSISNVHATSVTAMPPYNTGAPPTTGQGPEQVEATLDVSWAGGVAPGAKIRVYTTPTFDYGYLDDAYEQVIYDINNSIPIQILSLSYGASEYYSNGAVASDNNYMTMIAAKGVTVFVSSGDEGSRPGIQPDPQFPSATPYYSYNNPLAAESPASAVNVVAVGGTSLYNNQGTSESGWSVTQSVAFGSGGGLSVNARQSWQTGTGVPSGSGRCVPDVSLAADSNHPANLYVNGIVAPEGGTSWSAPTWAGFCALFNQARANSGSSALGGSLTSLLYKQLALAPPNAALTSALRDITSGSNGLDGNYTAGTGYDLVTGLGVPNVAVLGHALAAPFFTNEVDYNNGFYYLALPNGTPFGTYCANASGYTFPQICHVDMGFEYIFNANDSENGIYMYDYSTGHFFYTSQTLSFPYLYDFSLNSFLYYYPANSPGRYTRETLNKATR